MEKLKKLAKVILENFGPVLVFYGVNTISGLKPAIAASTLYSVGEIASKVRKKEKLTSIFKYSAVMILTFGGVDLCFQQSFLFKYEASMTNLLVGLFFGASLFSEKTIIQEFYENTDNTKPTTRDRVVYFKFLTTVWVTYFFVKACAYYWMSSRVSMKQGLVLRAIIGSASFYAMLFVSILGSKTIFPWMKKWNLLPAAEDEVKTA